MNKKVLKFGIGIVLILSTGLWLAFSGFDMGKAYYVTVSELYAMGDEAYVSRLKVAGDVVEGSIKRENNVVKFLISENYQEVVVHYIGDSVLPDTFKDGAKAVVEGSYSSDGVFKAHHIQAKCASKYEAEYETRAVSNS